MKPDPKHLALILSLVGLALMYQVAGLQPETVEISELDRSMIGEKVTVEGTVENLSTSPNTLFFDIKDGKQSISAVSFRENLFIKEGSRIKASGKITLYKGELKITVNRVKIQD